MRISSSQVFNSGIQRLQDSNVQQQKTQQQVASGKKLLTPSDDPVAATRILQLKQELTSSEQFKNNINLSTNRLQRQDSVLSSMNEGLIRVRELTIQAGDGALNMSDRKALATELRQVLDQMASLANTRGPDGEYLYSGHKGQTQPFQQDSGGKWVYQGDEGRRSVEIDKGVSLAVTNNGKEAFVDVPSDRPTFSTRGSEANSAQPPASISTGMIIDREQFEDFYPDDLVVKFDRDASGNTVYSINSRDTGRELVSNAPYQSGQPIAAAGMQFEVEGDPEAGDAFFVETSKKQGILTTVEKLIHGLENHQDNSAGRDALRDTIDQALANLDNGQNRALEIQSSVGTRLNTLESTGNFLGDSDLLTREVLSGLEDLDYAEAISRLTQQTFVLQAAQQSFAQISRLSLFDSL
ncbi:MAG: flagellar hook-associated protein 3 [Halomonadaceae bacterium]|nr:MAG: flagellar hook-associated protein 3 [Halomonadaceae bacterium]